MEETVGRLQELAPAMLDWERKHGCRYGVPKFQLAHFTRSTMCYKPLPLTIGEHSIQPTEAVKYLRVVIDCKLWWREQVESAVAKGTCMVLAIGQLTEPSFGMPH